MTSVWHWGGNSVNNVVNKLIIPNGKRMLKGYKLFSPQGVSEHHTVNQNLKYNFFLKVQIFWRFQYSKNWVIRHHQINMALTQLRLSVQCYLRGRTLVVKRLTSVNTRIVPTLKYLGFFSRNGPMWPRNSLCGFKAHFKNGMDSFHYSLHENHPLFVKTETLQ